MSTYCEICSQPIAEESEFFLLNRGGTPHYYHEKCINMHILYIDEWNVMKVQPVAFGTSPVYSSGSTGTYSLGNQNAS